jgi:phage host-nuclease inhibitor protein Gam
MAKTATARKLEEPAEPATHEITTLQEADLALDRLGELSDQVGIYEARGRRAIRKVETWLNEKTAADMAEGAAIVVALEAFATRKRAELLPGDKKSLTLRFGSIGFRFTPWRIEYLKDMTEELILAKLKKLKLGKTAIRTTESVDKNAALKLDDQILAKAGMKKTREEKFVYALNPRAPAETVN